MTHPVERDARVIPSPEGSDTPRSGRALIADDSPTVRKVFHKYLEHLYADIVEVGDGQEAVRAVFHARRKAVPFDLILLDLHMPIVDGCEAAQRIRKVGYTGPLVAITGDDLPSEQQSALAAGCDVVLTKPVGWSDLLATIQSLTVGK